jgi:pimeloyl-ACP methyl ester carboxylesterase
MNPTYVFVHGAFANSFHWAAIQRELGLRGHRSVAVDLPGHGFQAPHSPTFQVPQDAAALATAPSPLAGVTHAENVASVVDVVRRAAAHGPVILVGHSRGGLTITGVGNAVPDLIHRIVYISAHCCVDLTPAEYAATPEHGPPSMHEGNTALVGDPLEIGAIRQNWRSLDEAKAAALKSVLLADGTEEEFLTFLNLLDPDENLDVGGPDDRAQAATWGRIPRTYIRLTADLALPVTLQDRYIKEADALTPNNQFDVWSVDSSHLGFQLRPEEVATILADLANLPD